MDGMGPFPLHPDAKRLKPHLGKLLAPISAVILFIVQGPLKDADYRKYIHGPLDWPMLLTLGVIALIILYLVTELVLKRIYYSPSGVGIARSGSTPTWYPFDELREVRVSRPARTLKGKQTRSSRVKLVFQTGQVSISGGLYNTTQMLELVEIVQSRKPHDINPKPSNPFAPNKDRSLRNQNFPWE